MHGLCSFGWLKGSLSCFCSHSLRTKSGHSLSLLELVILETLICIYVPCLLRGRSAYSMLFGFAFADGIEIHGLISCRIPFGAIPHEQEDFPLAIPATLPSSGVWRGSCCTRASFSSRKYRRTTCLGEEIVQGAAGQAHVSDIIFVTWTLLFPFYA